MPRVIRRLAGVVLPVAVILALLVGEAGAEAPGGPRLAYLSASDARSEILSVDPSGGEPALIAGGGERVRPLPLPFGSISWSPDGSLLAFDGLSGGRGESRIDLYVVAADGTGVRRILGTRDAVFPFFSSDGHEVAFTRIGRTRDSGASRGGRSRPRYSTWLADLATGAVTKLPTKGSDLASSFSPDGMALAVSRGHRGGGADIVTIDLASGRGTLLARNAGEPVYSPNGSRIAFLRGPVHTFHDRRGSTTETLTDIYAMSADGSGVARITRTPRLIELGPSWDPSGQRLAYTQIQAGPSEARALGIGDSIMEINLDGSCRTRIVSVPRTILLSPAWQPGSGREAGPIAC
jgi:Tol biopolymer transport system component